MTLASMSTTHEHNNVAEFKEMGRVPRDIRSAGQILAQMGVVFARLLFGRHTSQNERVVHVVHVWWSVSVLPCFGMGRLFPKD